MKTQKQWHGMKRGIQFDDECISCGSPAEKTTKYGYYCEQCWQVMQRMFTNLLPGPRRTNAERLKRR